MARAGASTEYLVRHAEEVILKTWGDQVSVDVKGKDLFKFGLRDDVDTNEQTIMTLPTGLYHEVYATTNAITHVSSSSSSDTGTMTYEGHTVDGSGNFTFVTGSFTLQGTTKVALPTAVARITRGYNTGSTNLVGTVYFYENDTTNDVAGVPDTDAKVHMMVEAGYNQSNKAATTISNNDYYILTGGFATILKKAASALVDINFEVRQKGGVFRKQFPTAVTTSSSNSFQYHFEPYFIVPKNADVRVVATGSTTGIEVTAGFNGYLAQIIT